MTNRRITMTILTRLPDPGRTQPVADKFLRPQSAAERRGDFRDFVIVCAWAAVGITLTIAAAIGFGLQIQ
jgi:hypothetical protein